VPTALLIMLRDGFEAALVVAIVYAYIRRIDRPDLVGPMWQGIAAAGALSVGAGVVVRLAVMGVAFLRLGPGLPGRAGRPPPAHAPVLHPSPGWS
jgi:FTR1 family protein